MEYPKINSLYKRQMTETDTLTGEVRFLDKGKSGNPLIIGDFACEEFGAIETWTVTEKIDGTNIRIIMDRKHMPLVTFGGRTSNAQIPTSLLRHLQTTFTSEKMDEVFKESNYVVLFGEGYGPKIQSGIYYRSDVSFVLFDVYCSGWWLTRPRIQEVALSLGIECVNPLAKPIPGKSGKKHLWTREEIEEYVRKRKNSLKAKEPHVMEGLIARSEPQMMFRKGGPIMFKLKCSDFK